MPYIKTGAPQKKTGAPGIRDVYHSTNVFANNVPIALWNPPGKSGAFNGLKISVAVVIPEQVQQELATKTQEYVAAQTGAPNQYYKPEAAADGVKGNFTGTPDDQTTTVGTVARSAKFSNIIPFLQQTLEEASRGMWRETGQGGKPSNPNILGIWNNLGYSAASPWNTDQTAWCMGFVNFALKNSAYTYVQTASAAALTQNPERWGATQVPKDQAQPGDIAFWSYRHVNFVYTATDGKFSFVGGNQTPKGGSNNPDDGDVTISYPGGTTANNSNWVSCWRPNKPA